MNNTDLEYQRLLRLILEKGRVKKNRTGTDTIGVFGAQARFNLQEGFPLLTTKKMAVKAITHELLWFINGDTNIKYLVDNGCNIWNGDAYRNFKAKFDSSRLKPFDSMVGDIGNSRILNKEEFIEKIKADAEFAAKYGDLGQGTYGQMWRTFPYHIDTDVYWGGEACKDENMVAVKETGTVDQLQKVIDKLKTNPDDRRMIVSAWHPYWVDHCALPPCHCLFHFNTEELTHEERRQLYYKDGKYENYHKKGGLLLPAGETAFDDAGVPRRRLNCLLYQRSCDFFLGIPLNIASYSMLLSMVAQVTDMVPGEFIHTYGDAHLYQNHVEQAKLQLTREPYPLPKLWLNPEVKNLFKFTYDDIKILDYQCHPTIKGDLSVG